MELTRHSKMRASSRQYTVGGVLKLIATATNLPRALTVVGAQHCCFRGVGLSRKLSWSQNRLLLQQICAYRVHRRCGQFVIGGGLLLYVLRR